MVDHALPLLLVMRYINVMIWMSVALRLTPSAVRAFRRHAQSLDPLWAVFWGIAVNRLWLWLHGTAYGEVTSPDSAFVLLCSWYGFAILLGIAVHKLRTWYGTGKARI